MEIKAQNNIIDEVIKTLETSIYGATLRDKYIIEVHKGNVNGVIRFTKKDENDDVDGYELMFFLGWFSRE
nr:hypothetical protein [uncultured Sphingobacterium sp.]